MYTTRVARPRELRPRHAVQNQWDLLDRARARPAGRERLAGRDARRSRGRSRDGRTAGAGRRARDRSAGRRARERGQPVPAVAAAFVRAPGRRAWPSHRGGGSSSRPGPRSARRPAASSTDARGRLAPADGERVVDSANSSLAELRGLLDRAALYIGGDSGPLHIAATSRGRSSACTDRRSPVRSAPWRTIAGDRIGGGARPAVPPVRSAGLRPGRFPLPHAHFGGHGD